VPVQADVTLVLAACGRRDRGHHPGTAAGSHGTSAACGLKALSEPSVRWTGSPEWRTPATQKVGESTAFDIRKVREAAVWPSRNGRRCSFLLFLRYTRRHFVMSTRPQRIVVITGGGGELGRSMAQAFSQQGARLVLLDLRPNLQKAQTLVRKLPEGGIALRCDVSCEPEVRKAFELVRHRWGRLDVLINNAGVQGPTGKASHISLADWERTLAVNLTGAFLCAREAIPLMRKAGGTIIQIGSVAGRIAYGLRLPYAVSKGALEALTRGLAAELGRRKIRVNLVAPGPIAGEPMDRVIRSRARVLKQSPQIVRDSYLRASMLGTMVSAVDVVNAVVFLCSPAAARITGQVLEISAGWTATVL
jgi:NAD(P)-dependent dehydrogenase (short-subunit alcohol dehydrogenase family)